jgi:hypothetical protein
MRQGITESELAALREATGADRTIEAFSLHLPIDRPPGTDPVAETARWADLLMTAGLQVTGATPNRQPRNGAWRNCDTP